MSPVPQLLLAQQSCPSRPHGLQTPFWAHTPPVGQLSPRLVHDAEANASAAASDAAESITELASGSRPASERASACPASIATEERSLPQPISRTAKQSLPTARLYHGGALVQDGSTLAYLNSQFYWQPQKWHSGGRRFDPVQLHYLRVKLEVWFKFGDSLFDHA